MVQTYVLGIDVVYGSQPSHEPPNAVVELNGYANDVNKDFKGSFVWLIPVGTDDANDACTSFKVVIQGSPDHDQKDLAKGSGGDFRYLIPSVDRTVSEKIISIRLLRASSAVASPPAGYSGMTSDINKDRGKSYLYLIWATTTV